MPAKVFVTGFPGFLGSELVRRILARPGRPDVVCLVQPKFAALAARRVEEIAATEKVDAGRIALVEGDITRHNLDLEDVDGTAKGVTEIFHLAAIYDLSVPREVGLKVNVTGTRHVLHFAERCTSLERHQYVSTCYVSGRYTGIFRETDLEKGQQFNNFYEETKYLAELEVRRKMEEGMPTTIYRPAVVVGDSKTGETQKYDGPYYVIRWLLKQPTLAFLPIPGHPDRTRINLVPRDFVVAAIDALSQAKGSAGRCYQLADPEPPTIAEVIRLMAEATGRAIVQVPTPLGLAKLAIDKVPGVYRLMEIPSSSVDYFVHPTFYDTTNATRDLAKAGIVCPRFADYLPNLVSFFRQHPEIASDAMV